MEDDYFEVYKTFLESAIGAGIEEGVINTDQNYLEMLINGENVDNFIIMLMSVHAAVLTELREEIDKVYDSFDVELAIDEDLDALGDLVGVSRLDGSKASVILTFALPLGAEETITVPEGIIVRTDTNIRFVTDEPIIFDIGSKETDVLALAMVEGTNQNVEANSIRYIESELPDGLELTVNNNDASVGGSSMQDDDEFREIVKNSFVIHQRGSLGAYEQYFEDYDGLRSYNIVPLWDGPGTIKIVLEATENIEYHREKVEEELREDVLVADEDLTVIGAEKQNITLDIIADVGIDSIYPVSDLMKKQIASKIVDSVYTYVNGGTTSDGEVITGLGIGDDFIPFQLAVFVNENIYEVQSLRITYPDSVIVAKEDNVINIADKNDIHVQINTKQ